MIAIGGYKTHLYSIIIYSNTDWGLTCFDTLVACLLAWLAVNSLMISAIQTNTLLIFHLYCVLFRICTLKYIFFRSLENHLDTISSGCFSPDGAVIITVSYNSDFRIWSTGSCNCLYTKDDAHDGGVQFCDISDNLEPIPNAIMDGQCYLLATCGNDSLVKLWRISVPNVCEF